MGENLSKQNYEQVKLFLVLHEAEALNPGSDVVEHELGDGGTQRGQLSYKTEDGLIITRREGAQKVIWSEYDV